MRLISNLALLLPLLLISFTHAIDWPVFFEHLGHVHSTHNYWDLSLDVNLQLPKLEKRVQILSQRLDRLRVGLLSSSEEEEEISGESRRDEAQVDSLKQVNAHLKRRALLLLREIRGLKGFSRGFDGSFFGENIKSRLRKREVAESLMAFDGRSDNPSGVLQSLFGIAYRDEVTGVETRLTDLESRIVADIENVNVQTRSIADSTDNKIRLTDGELRKVENMTEALEKKVTNMEISPLFRSASSGNLQSRREMAYEEIRSRLDTYSDRLASIKSIISSLASGRLSLQILPMHKLRLTLSKITNQLPPNITLLFDVKESLWPYYNLLDVQTDFGRDLVDLQVSMRLPLIDEGNTLDLSRVHNLPLKVRDGYSVTADIDTEFIVTDVSRAYYLELFKEDLSECKVYPGQGSGRHFYCNLGPMLKAQKSHSCVMSLFQGNTDTALCQSRLKHGLVAPFNRLHNGSWIFSALIEQVPVLLKCPDGDTPTGLIGFGVIHLAEGCSISSKEYFYPDTFSSQTRITINFGELGSNDALLSVQEGGDHIPTTDEVPEGTPFNGGGDEDEDPFETEVFEAVEAEEEEYDGVEDGSELSFQEFVNALAESPNAKFPLGNTSSLLEKSRILSLE